MNQFFNAEPAQGENVRWAGQGDRAAPEGHAAAGAGANFFDVLEHRQPAEREAALLAALPRNVAHAKAHAPAFAQILANVSALAVNSRAALARLPVTRKQELFDLQKAGRPHDSFGGFSTLLRGPKMQRMFASPGPIYEPEGIARDYWRTGRAMYAA